jgi:hypothetical protein
MSCGLIAHPVDPDFAWLWAFGMLIILSENLRREVYYDYKQLYIFV